MRITQGMMVANQVTRLQGQLARFERTQSQLGTGKHLLKPSDDPAAANRGLILRADQRARLQEERNAADARTWLDLADSKLQGAMARLQRARELMVASGSSGSVENHRARAAEITEIRDEIMAIANAEHGGQPLFAGTTRGPAVNTATGAYVGNDGRIERRIGENDTVEVNVTAQEAFGVGGAGDVLALLDQVAAAMNAGDEAQVSGRLGDMDAAMTRVGDSLATVGAATNRVEAAMQRNTDAQLALRTELSEVEDVDVAEAVMELQTQEVAYQSTLAALSRVLQPSLVDFLR